jgi:hypothetical protein
MDRRNQHWPSDDYDRSPEGVWRPTPEQLRWRYARTWPTRFVAWLANDGRDERPDP